MYKTKKILLKVKTPFLLQPVDFFDCVLLFDLLLPPLGEFAVFVLETVEVHAKFLVLLGGSFDGVFRLEAVLDSDEALLVHFGCLS
jgi:hypothetical protein